MFPAGQLISNPKFVFSQLLGNPTGWMRIWPRLLPLIAALFINSFNNVELTFDKTFSFLKIHSFWFGGFAIAFFRLPTSL